MATVAEVAEQGRLRINWEDPELFPFVADLQKSDEKREDVVSGFKRLYAVGGLRPVLKLTEVAREMSERQAIMESCLEVNLDLGKSTVTYCRLPLSGNGDSAKAVDGRDLGKLRTLLVPLSSDAGSLTGLAAEINRAANELYTTRGHAKPDTGKKLTKRTVEVADDLHDQAQNWFLRGMQSVGAAMGQVHVDFAALVATTRADQVELAATLTNYGRLMEMTIRIDPDFKKLPADAQTAVVLKMQEKLNAVDIARETGDREKAKLRAQQEASLSLAELLKRTAGRGGRTLFGHDGVGDTMSDDLLQRVALMQITSGMSAEEVGRTITVIADARRSLALADKAKQIAVAEGEAKRLEVYAADRLAKAEALKAFMNAVASEALIALEKGVGVLVGSLPNEKNGTPGRGILGLTVGLAGGVPNAILTGTLTGAGNGIGNMIEAIQNKVKLPNIGVPEYSLTFVGVGTGVIVTTIYVGSSIILLASGGSIGAGAALFSVWSAREITKKLDSRFGKKTPGGARPMPMNDGGRERNAFPPRRERDRDDEE